MLLPRRLLLLLATHALTGCGARSSLLDAAVEAPPGCVPLTPGGSDVTLPDAAGFDAHGPALVMLGGGPRVAVVMGLHAVGGGSGPWVPQPVADVVLDPWGAWPPAVA